MIAYGQTFTVSGKISDAETGEALAFASVGLKDTNLGTSANLNGEFTLSIPEAQKEGKLVFNFLGYEPETIALNTASSPLTIKLKPATLELAEVVIRPLSAAEYVRKAMESRQENYALRFTGNAYFRQLVLDDKTPLQFTEGYFQTHVPNFLDSSQIQQRLLLFEQVDDMEELAFNAKRRTKKFEKAKRKAEKEGREFDEEAAREKVGIVSMGTVSPAEIIEGDPIRNVSGYLTAETLEDYEFEFQENTRFQGREMIVITFETRGKVKLDDGSIKGRQKGTLYFDKSTDALAAVDIFSKLIIPAAIKPVLYMAGYSISNPKIHQQVHYKFQDGKWLPQSTRVDLKLRLVRHYLFSSNEISNLKVNLLVNFTGWDTQNAQEIPKNKRFTNEKEMKDQVYPLPGITWDKVNRIPLER